MQQAPLQGRVRSLTFHSFCSINYYFSYYSMGGAIIWGRGRAGSCDLADVTTFNIGGGTSEILQL